MLENRSGQTFAAPSTWSSFKGKIKTSEINREICLVPSCSYTAVIGLRNCLPNCARIISSYINVYFIYNSALLFQFRELVHLNNLAVFQH
jgi:hypothetical protein